MHKTEVAMAMAPTGFVQGQKHHFLFLVKVMTLIEKKKNLFCIANRQFLPFTLVGSEPAPHCLLSGSWSFFCQILLVGKHSRGRLKSRRKGDATFFLFSRKQQQHWAPVASLCCHSLHQLQEASFHMSDQESIRMAPLSLQILGILTLSFYFLSPRQSNCFLSSLNSGLSDFCSFSLSVMQ